MTVTSSVLTDLLAECNAGGIRLLLAGGGGLTIDAPHDALTPDLLDRLKAHKAELLAVLQSGPIADLTQAQPFSANRLSAVCRCGSASWHDVPIHGGRSIRRDCGRCGRFIRFSLWYGNDT